MRKKLSPTDKRSKIIGIKVKPETAEKLKYISEIEDKKPSTYVNDLIEKHIEMITQIYKIDWSKEINQERRDSGDQ